MIGAWLVGEAAKDMEVHSDQEVMDACYRELKAFLDNIYDIPYPEEIIRYVILLLNLGLAKNIYFPFGVSNKQVLP